LLSIESYAKYKILCGANNETHLVEREKAGNVIKKFADGFSIVSSVGYWKNEREDSIKIDLVSDMRDEIIKQVQEQLCSDLKQQAVLVTVSQQEVFL